MPLEYGMFDAREHLNAREGKRDRENMARATVFGGYSHSRFCYADFEKAICPVRSLILAYFRFKQRKTRRYDFTGK